VSREKHLVVDWAAHVVEGRKIDGKSVRVVLRKRGRREELVAIMIAD